MRFAICNELFEDWPLERVLDYCAAIGYDGVEVAPFTLAEDIRTLSAERVTALRQASEKAGIPIIGLHWLLTKPDGLSINGPDRAARLDTIDFMYALIRLCSDLGGSVMVFGSPNQRNVQEGDTYEAVWQRSVASFKAVGAEAERRGVTLALEPLTRKETNFLLTKDETVRLIDAVGSPAVRLHLDVKAMVGEEERPAETIIREGAEHLAHFHANDVNLRGPGFGEVDFTPIAAALTDIGYDGFVSVEVFDYSPDAETVATESLAYLKDVLPS